MILYLYDPRTNITTEIKRKDLIGIAGVSTSAITKALRNKTRIASINCYVTREKASLKQRRKWYESQTYENENWKIVEGSNGKYKVSNQGRIKRIYKSTERFCLPFQRKGRGNLFVKITFLDVYKEHKVGHIVAHHFLRQRRENERLIHKNGIITDDYAGNLEYVTKQELGRKTGYKSRSMPVVQLDLETFEVINEFRSIREAARECYIAHEAIRMNCLGLTKHSGGYKFMFLDDYEKHGLKRVEPITRKGLG